ATQTYVYYYDGATPAAPDVQTDHGLLTAVVGNGYTKLLAYRPDGKLTRRTLSLMGWRTAVTDIDYADSDAPREESITITDGQEQPRSRSTHRYRWNELGQLAGVQLNGADLARFGYDENGQPKTADFSRGEVSQGVVLDYDGLTRRMVRQSQT